MNFQGFDPPEQNWAEIPLGIVDNLPKFSSLAELVIVLYIACYRTPITIDELLNGRKSNNGARINAGTGLSKPSIIRGIKEARNHGFIAQIVHRGSYTYTLVHQDQGVEK